MKQQAYFQHPEDDLFQIGFLEGSPFFWPLHFHEMIEILYCVEGSFQYLVGDSSHTVHAGETILVFPGMNHGCINTTPGKTKIHMCLVSTRIYFDLPVDFTTRIPVCPVVRNTEQILYVWNDILRIHAGDPDDLLLPYYIRILLLLLVRCFPLVPRNESYSHKNSVIANHISNYIASHYTENLTLQSVANAVGINRYSVSKIIHTVMKMSFCDVLNNYRLSAAETMLLNTNMKITSIAAGAGFSSLPTFNRIFKEKHAISPHQYRLQHTT